MHFGELQLRAGVRAHEAPFTSRASESRQIGEAARSLASGLSEIADDALQTISATPDERAEFERVRFPFGA
jgi:hypothetical protein